MNKLKHSMVGAGLIVALSLGAAAVPVASNASVERSSATSSVIAGSGTVSVSGGASGAASAPRSGTTPVAASSGQQAGVIARAFIAAVKKWGAAAFKAMVKAIKASYKAFVRWLGTVPGWVKNTAGALGTSALYDAIKHILGL